MTSLVKTAFSRKSFHFREVLLLAFRFVKKVRRNFGGIPSSLFRSFVFPCCTACRRLWNTIFESNGGFIYTYIFLQRLQKRRLLALSVLRVWILIVVVFWRKMQRFRVLFAGLTGVESVALDEARRRRLERGDRVLSHTTMLHTWSLTSSNTVS